MDTLVRGDRSRLRGDRLLRQVVRYGGGWTVALAATALVGATAKLLLPAVLGRAVDDALAGDPGWWPTTACALVTLLILTDAATDLVAGHGTARATARLRDRVLRHLFTLEPRTAGRYPVGDLVGRLAGQAADAGQVGTATVVGLVALLPPVGSIVALLLLAPVLGLTMVAGLVLLAVLMRTFVADASRVGAQYQRVQGDIAGRLVEALAGARTIAAAATARQEATRVLAPLPELASHGRRSWELLARAAGRTAAVAPLLQLCVVAVGGYALTVGWLTPGELVAAVQYAALGAGLGAVLATLNRLVRCRAGAHRVATVLDEPAIRYGSAVLPPGGGALRLCGVTVRAPDGRPVLHHLDLAVPAGSMVAVVGKSGAGKSTLAAVAGRLQDPDAGEVLLDGVPLHQLSRAALRRAVGYAFERPVLVGETLHDAIGLSLAEEQAAAPVDGRTARPAVRQAARDAAVDGYVGRLPEGYRTALADAPLSGGEAQRLGVARALSAERLLILDDATSSLDTATAHRIGQTVVERSGGRTRLVVTHRAATAAAADLVAWLHDGRLRALASHRRLWSDPAYRSMFLPSEDDR